MEHNNTDPQAIKRMPKHHRRSGSMPAYTRTIYAASMLQLTFEKYISANRKD
jgi:hypothetical protein